MFDATCEMSSCNYAISKVGETIGTLIDKRKLESKMSELMLYPTMCKQSFVIVESGNTNITLKLELNRRCGQ